MLSRLYAENIPKLEGIMHDPKGQHNIIVIITLNVFGDLKK